MEQKLTLDFPFTKDGIQYTELNIARPKVKDRLAASRKAGTDAEKEVFLFAKLCNTSPDVIEEMDASDYQRLQEVLSDFFIAPSQKQNSSQSE